jgi:hypothetical protein
MNSFVPKRLWWAGLALGLAALYVHQTAWSAGEAAPPPIVVRAEINKPTIHIGERVRYTIIVDSDPSVEVTMPTFGERLGAFAIKDFGADGPKTSEGNRVRRTQWYLLDTFLLGGYPIPPARVLYRQAGGMERYVESPALFLTVEKMLATPEAMKDIRDIQDVVESPSRFSSAALILWAGVTGAVVLFLAGWWLWRRGREKAAEAAVRAAHEIAYEQLDRLQGANLIAAGKVREYHFRLSEIARYYIQNRFKIYAPDMTTEEFLDTVARTRVLQDAHSELVRQFLQHCDLVKFAKYSPQAFEIQEAYLSARRLVDETKAAEAPASTNAPASVGA